MKTKILAVVFVLVCLCAVCSPAAGAAQNMIINGDFEGSDMSQYNNLQLGMPDNMPIIVSGGHSGKCIQLGGDDEGNGWPTWTNFRIGNLTLKKGHTYRMDGWIKGTERILLSAQAHLFASTKEPNKHKEVYYPVSAAVENRGVQVTTEWKSFSFEFTMSSPNESVDKLIVDATDWNIFFQYDTTWMPPQDGVTFPVSCIYFDDLMLVEVEKPVSQAPVSQEAPSTAAPQSETPSIQESESNGDESESESESPSSVSGSSSKVAEKDGDGGEPNYMIIIIIALVVILAGNGALMYFMLIRKKPALKTEEPAQDSADKEADEDDKEE